MKILKSLLLHIVIMTVLWAASMTNIKSQSQVNFTQADSQFIDSVIQKAIEKGIIPGAVVSIRKSGYSIYEKAFGHAQLYEFGKEIMALPRLMTVDHIFDLASLTKVFATTFGIMSLVDQEKLDIDKPVYTYLPEFRGNGKDSITVRQLLTHSGGLFQWKPLYFHARTPEEAYSYICSLPLSYPVGQGRHYSDLGFMLLGYIIQSVSGESLDLYLKNTFYDPLDLKYTSFNPPPNPGSFAATSHGNPFEKRMVEDDDFGYSCDENPGDFTEWRNYVLVGEVNDGNAFHAHKGVAGHAGLFSTARELQVLMQLLLNKGKLGGKTWINEKVIDQFLNKDEFGNGLGWAMSSEVLPVDILPEGSFGHTGFTGTYVLGVPSENLSLAILTNRQNMDVQESGYYYSVNELRREIVTRVLGSK